MTDSTSIEELLALEHAGWRSLGNGTGDRFYGDLMTENGLMVPADGTVMDRDTVISVLGQSPPWTRYEIDDVRLVEIGTDTAALVYTGTGWREGRGKQRPGTGFGRVEPDAVRAWGPRTFRRVPAGSRAPR